MIAVVCVLGFVYIAYFYDISRLFIGINSSNATKRETSFIIGLKIFGTHPIFGNGIGTFFLRAYEYYQRVLVYDGISGLIDPHNLYVYILAELGIAGLIGLVYMVCSVYKKLKKNIHAPILYKIGIVCMMAVLIDGIGGSQMINQPSYSIIIYSIISWLCAERDTLNEVSKKDYDNNIS